MTCLAEPRPRSDAGLACSLHSAELADRVSEWHSLRADALSAETVRDGVVVAVFARSADVMDRLQALIMEERSCCPFLDFKLREEDDLITVEVTTPPATPEADAETLARTPRRARRDRQPDRDRTTSANGPDPRA